MKAINLCINRFDEDTKLSFADLYTKIDAGVEQYGDVSGVTKVEDETKEYDNSVSFNPNSPSYKNP
jgi:hypothetical protein